MSGYTKVFNSVLGDTKIEVKGNYKLKEITIKVGIQSTINIKDYEFAKPSAFLEKTFSVEGAMNDSQILFEADKMNDQINASIQGQEQRLLNKAIQSQSNKFRFSEIEGVIYCHVTDAINFLKSFHNITPNELAQYGARGTYTHSYFEHVTMGKELILNPNDVYKMKNGSLYLWKDIDNIKTGVDGFLAKHGKDFKFLQSEVFGHNSKERYCGTMDYLCEYKGDLYIADVKTTAHNDDYFMQTAAYRNTDQMRDKDIKGMVVFPINLKNKQCFGSPVFCEGAEKIDNYYQQFLKSLADFKKLTKFENI